MNCIICSNPTAKIIEHKMLKHQIYSCEKCCYRFVDTSKISRKQMIEEQKKGTFGLNFERNKFYSKLLKKIQNEIATILEIGTPKNYDLLKKINHHYGDKFDLFCFDLFKPNLPEYITFVDNLDKIKEKEFDLLLCIHTLEHIPSHELLYFTDICKKICTNFIFETPLCETTEEVRRSSTQPHYSFFSESSLRKLFSNSKINVKKMGSTIMITNIKEIVEN